MTDDDFDIDPLDAAIYHTVHDYVDPVTGRKAVPALSNATGWSKSLLQNYANPNEPSHFTVKQLRTLILRTGDKRALHQLAHDVGEACFPLLTKDFPANLDLISAWADWQGEIAETMQNAKTILDDNKVTADEVESLKRELVEDFEKGLMLLDVFKGMQEPEK
jgi:hypothetical protein